MNERQEFTERETNLEMYLGPERKTGLAEGVRSLTACLVNSEDARSLRRRKLRNWFRPNEFRKDFDAIKEKGLNVLYNCTSQYIAMHRLRCVVWVPDGSPVSILCLVSQVDGKDKYSEDGFDCFHIVGVAEASSGEQVSFLAHFDPKLFVDGPLRGRMQAKELLQAACRRLVSSAKPGTVDIAICGGNMPLKKELSSVELKEIPPEAYAEHEHKYVEGVETLFHWISEGVGDGFEPLTMTGPNARSGATHVYLKTDKRRFYLERPYQKMRMNRPYVARDTERKKWIWKEVVDE